MQPPLTSIGRTYRHLNRYRELIGILVKYGFQDIVEQLNLRYYVELGKSVLLQRPAEHAAQIPRAVRVRLIIEEMGTTFIKFGQIMSTRPDLIPEEFLVELRKLQDAVPPFPTPEAIRLIESELEAPLGELFATFDQTPIASASIARVYRATLPDGAEVAVKVQRSDIQKVIAVDLEIMMDLARLAEQHLRGFEALQPAAVVEEFARVIENELNFHVEARSIERFSLHFAGDPTVHIPAVFRAHSTKRVLTTAFVHGIKISEQQRLRDAGYDLALLATNGANAMMRQVFEHGFFHGDPHPGNLLALPGGVVCFLDFGMMGRLDKEHQEDLATMLACIVNRDDERLTQTILHVAVNPDEVQDPRGLKRSVTDFVERYAYLPLEQINAAEVLNDLLAMILTYRVKLPPEFYLLIKALVTIEGVGKQLNPQFDIVAHAQPYITALLRKRYDPSRIAQDLGRTSAELYRLLRDLPAEVRALLKFVRRGELHVNLETKSMEPVMKTWDRDANRLAFSIVLAALLMSSAVVILARVPPLWHTIPVLGLAGFAGALLMGIWLLIAIFTSGQL